MRFKSSSFGSRARLRDRGLRRDDEFTDQEWPRIKKLEPLEGRAPPQPYNMRDQDDDVAEARPDAVLRQGRGRGNHRGRPVRAPWARSGRSACVNCHDTQVLRRLALMSPGALANNGMIPGLSHGRSYLATNTGTDGEPRTGTSGRCGGAVRLAGRARAGVWGTSATPLAQARFRLREVQGRVERGLPG